MLNNWQAATPGAAMAYVARPSDFHGNAVPYAPVASEAALVRRGLLRRIYDALMQANQRQAQRDIERFVSRRGRRLTDSVEREINARIFDNGWNRYR